MSPDVVESSIKNQLIQLARDKAAARNHPIPTIKLQLRRLWLYIQRYGDWTEHYLEIGNIRRDLACFHAEVESVIKILEVATWDSSEAIGVITQCMGYFSNYKEDSRNFAIEYPTYILREVDKILKSVNYNIPLLRSTQSIDRQIVEIFDSLLIDNSPNRDSFYDWIYYYGHNLFTIVRHRKVINYFKSKLSLAQYVSNLKSYYYSDADRDRILLAVAKLASIPCINLKIARESKRFLSKYKSRQHRDTLEYILRIVQSQLPAHKVNICGSEGIMSKENFLQGWFGRNIYYREHPITSDLQPGDIIKLKEGEFVLNKDLIPLDV